MIVVSRLNGERVAVNPDLIERAESTPDTVVTLVNGNRYVLAESLDELLARIDEHRATVTASAMRMASLAAAAEEPGPRSSVLPHTPAGRPPLSVVARPE